MIQLRKCSAWSRPILTWSIWKSVNRRGRRRRAISLTMSGTSGNPSDDKSFWWDSWLKSGAVSRGCNALFHVLYETLKLLSAVLTSFQTDVSQINALLLFKGFYINHGMRNWEFSPSKWLSLHVVTHNIKTWYACVVYILHPPNYHHWPLLLSSPRVLPPLAPRVGTPLAAPLACLACSVQSTINWNNWK